MSVPTVTLSARKGVGERESSLGPCSLLMVALNRGSGGSHAQGHWPCKQTHRRCSRAACDRITEEHREDVNRCVLVFLFILEHSIYIPKSHLALIIINYQLDFS